MLRSREILLHAAIGGAVGAGLAAFELVVRQWLHQSLETGINWTWLWALLGVFSVVFLGIASIEAILNWIPIRVQAVGYVGGHWIDEIRDKNRVIVGGAVIEIKSSRGEGFLLIGKSYSYESGTLKDWGTFDGRGSLFSPKGLSYHYTGSQEGGIKEQDIKDEGVAYYGFSRDPVKKEIKAFSGAFYSFTQHAAFAVNGRNVQKHENAEFKKDQGKTLLQNWLKSREEADKKRAEGS